jgi:hypothetical protein
VVVGSTDGNVYVLDTQGKLRWRHREGGPVMSTPHAVDLDADGVRDLVFATGTHRAVVAIHGRPAEPARPWPELAGGPLRRNAYGESLPGGH